MAKLNKWANIIKNVANKMRGQGRSRSKANRVDQVPSMDPTTPDVAQGNTAPKRSLGIMNKAFENMKKRNQPKIDPAFDIFPEEMQSSFENQEDRYISREVDGNDTGFDNYLKKRKAKKQKTPTEYNEPPFERKTAFSSPDDTQEIVEPTNTDMSDFDEIETGVTEYSDPIISTLPTPTSKKMGVPRPGPSTFIQTGKYNPQTKRLNVQFTDGSIFPYENVSPELADYILTKKSAHSPGRAILNTIFYNHGTTKNDRIDNIDEGM